MLTITVLLCVRRDLDLGSRTDLTSVSGKHVRVMLNSHIRRKHMKTSYFSRHYFPRGAVFLINMFDFINNKTKDLSLKVKQISALYNLYIASRAAELTTSVELQRVDYRIK